MAVLVTGGAGSIGSAVVRELRAAGHAAVVLDVRRAPDAGAADVPAVQGDIEDLDLLLHTIEQHGVDRVIHLAAFLQFGCAENPWKAVEVNVQGTLNVLEASRRAKVKKIVFASSGAAYGPRTESMGEDLPILPGVSLYGATKFVGEVLLRQYRDLYGIPFAALRYGAVYGPGTVHSPGIADVIKRIESTVGGRDVVVDEVGADDHRHFLYVKDAARGTVAALLAGDTPHAVFNLAGGSDSYVTFGRLHGIIKSLHPEAGNVVFRGKGKGQDRGRIDITRARAELGFEPRFSLEDGIREDIELRIGKDMEAKR